MAITITAGRLSKLLDKVPDETPIYVIGDNNENGIVNNVTIECLSDTDFQTYQVRIDYEL